MSVFIKKCNTVFQAHARLVRLSATVTHRDVCMYVCMFMYIITEIAAKKKEVEVTVADAHARLLRLSATVTPKTLAKALDGLNLQRLARDELNLKALGMQDEESAEERAGKREERVQMLLRMSKDKLVAEYVAAFGNLYHDNT